jgi:hypothetical protein
MKTAFMLTFFLVSTVGWASSAAIALPEALECKPTRFVQGAAELNQPDKYFPATLNFGREWHEQQEYDPLVRVGESKVTFEHRTGEHSSFWYEFAESDVNALVAGRVRVIGGTFEDSSEWSGAPSPKYEIECVQAD